MNLVIEFVNKDFGCYSEGYENTNDDSGFDLYIPTTQIISAKSFANKIKLGIKLAMYDTNANPVGFMLLPRSSTGVRTPLRLSNSVGIIDSGYRGEIIACVDNLSDESYICEAGSRLFQIVPFSGEGIKKVIFGKVDNTLRGENGFGSSGN